MAPLLASVVRIVLNRLLIVKRIMPHSWYQWKEFCPTVGDMSVEALLLMSKGGIVPHISGRNSAPRDE